MCGHTLLLLRSSRGQLSGALACVVTASGMLPVVCLWTLVLCLAPVLFAFCCIADSLTISCTIIVIIYL